METSELLKKVRKIEIKTKGLSSQIFSGEYQSAFKGRGMSFSEVRPYHYGDDVRNIDWNVTARTGDAHVKVFEEERELTLMLLVDISASQAFGASEESKNEVVTLISAVLAFSATNNNDKVGCIFFTDRIEKFIPPKKGKQHILRIIRELLDYRPEGKKTSLKVALEYLNNVIKKKCITFILSDFVSENYDDALRITARRHDVIGIHMYDQTEKELPNVGLIRTYDMESGLETIIDTSSKAVRQKHTTAFENNFKYFTSNFNKCGADYISLETKESYVNALLKFFKKRGR